ncbi:MAG: uroporphyrinogen-III C-methyltransferase [Rhodoferax sp.]|nr:uroporphyrinogen-III C-methyltransferase [Rhodoferax sp.]
MTTEPETPASSEPAQAASAPAAPGSSGLAGVAAVARVSRGMVLVGLLALGGVLGSVLLWHRLDGIQQQLARQTADAGEEAGQARLTARQAEELALETAAKLAVTEAKLAEVSLQRSQLEELMQSLSRSRDENLVVDIESALRLAQQQAQLTGSIEPLLAALKTADQRVARAAQPRLTTLQRAIARDVARVKTTALADTPALLVKLDELATMADDLPLGNAVGATHVAAHTPADKASNPASATQRKGDAGEGDMGKPDDGLVAWWWRIAKVVEEEFRSLVRVSRIENPDAALLSPEQSFFLRENLKLRLLNARLGLLSRQVDSARTDLGMAALAIEQYFDGGSRKTQTAVALLQQVQMQMRSLEIPRIDDTLAALATAAAGR